MDREPDGLTLRLVALLADGRSAAEAAAACNVSVSTMSRRLLALRVAWELENNMQVIVQAARRGLI